MTEKVFIVLFDAKMKTYTDRRQYIDFLKLLKRNGFRLLQKSVYLKFCVDSSSLKTQSNKIKQFTPNNIRVIILEIPLRVFANGSYFNCKSPELLKNKTIVCV